jgi:hypothetical protein
MFLGCQKINYHAKHYNIDPKEKGILEDLSFVGKTSSCSYRTGIDHPKLQMEEEEDRFYLFQILYDKIDCIVIIVGGSITCSWCYARFERFRPWLRLNVQYNQCTFILHC